jgi:hypothetical protein
MARTARMPRAARTVRTAVTSRPVGASVVVVRAAGAGAASERPSLPPRTGRCRAVPDEAGVAQVTRAVHAAIERAAHRLRGDARAAVDGVVRAREDLRAGSCRKRGIARCAGPVRCADAIATKSQIGPARDRGALLAFECTRHVAPDFGALGVGVDRTIRAARVTHRWSSIACPRSPRGAVGRWAAVVRRWAAGVREHSAGIAPRSGGDLRASAGAGRGLVVARVHS